MSDETGLDNWVEVDQYLAAFESARRAGPTDFASFLPPVDSPLSSAVLREIVRVDMEFGWAEGRPTGLGNYRARLPQLFADPTALAEIAFEEYRLRRQAGERIEPGEYERAFGVDLGLWPSALMSGSARADHSTQWAQQSPGAAVGAAAPAPLAFPQVGERFAGFELLAEIGRGTFSRVFLAEQPALANRLIVLKVCERVHAESERLAQLQHTHVVPIYSVHGLGRLQAICMPYFGATTLADITKLASGRKSLPASGRALLETVIARAGATVSGSTAWGSSARLSAPAPSDTQIRRADAAPTVAEPDSAMPAPRSAAETPTAPRSATAWSAESRLLNEMSYVEAVLWIMARSAEGLAHAHERGIVHQDLKPANILLSDEGRPMLLDFNLSIDLKQRSANAPQAIGGTLPYMAPEQLRALVSGAGGGDPRADIYSLGVLLYELLTGRLPYPAHYGAVHQIAARMADERREAPPSARRANRSITPAIESILSRCLAYDPANRYATARQLCEDLDRHLVHRPLAHAGERSWRERAQKWCRRHPRLSSASSMAVAAAVVLVALASLLVVQRRAHNLLAAREEVRQTLAQIHSAGLLVERPDASPAQLETAHQLRSSIADRFGLLHAGEWRLPEPFDRLDGEVQSALAQSLTEMLVGWAWSEAALGRRAGEPAERTRRLDAAWQLNERAEACAASETPKFVLEQRATLAEWLGRDAEEIARWKQAAGDAAPRSARDTFFTAMQALAQQRFSDAETLLRQATREAPHDLLGWMLLGHAYLAQARFEQAIGCYSTCLALSPESAWIWFNRGLAYQRRGDLELAEDDYTMALRFDPALMEALLNRGITRLERGQPRPALTDFLAASRLPHAPARLHFLLARAHLGLGDRAAHAEALAAGLEAPPTDAESWVARGMARLVSDPRAALADFEAALQVDARCLPALLDRASVLSERLGETEQGIAALDGLLAEFPNYTEAISSRAVLAARLGRRDAALADAREALRRDGRPGIVYQVAGAYALTSRQAPDDRHDALRLLERAFAQGFGLELVDRDPDLAPLRGDAEFTALVGRFRAAHTNAVRLPGPAAAAN